MAKIEIEIENKKDDAPEEKGRSTDTVVGHLSLGEVVIPRAFLDDEDFHNLLKRYFEENDMDLAEFTVGDKANKINPETGYPEFFSRSFRRMFRSIAPIALSVFAPGLGTALGSALGAGTTFAPILGGAALGAGTSALTGGNPFTGALMGGAGSALSGALGTAAGTPLAGGVGPTQGSGLLGSVTRGASELGSVGRTLASGLSSLSSPVSAGGGASALGGGSGLSSIANIGSGIQNYMAQDKMERQLKNANAQAQAVLAPYQQTGQLANERLQRLAGLRGEDLQSELMKDPSYQFRFGQGMDALNRNLAASGSLDSGRAMQAAMDLGQQMASQEYGNAFERNQSLAGFGANVGGSLANLLGQRGDIASNAIAGRTNTVGQTLANLLGTGVGGNRPVGQDDMMEKLMRFRMMGLA